MFDHSRLGAQEIRAFSASESLNNATDPAQETCNCVFGSLAQTRLRFAERPAQSD
jgi:hypothetical protein